MTATDRLFDTVFVRPPADSYVKCVSTNAAKTNIDARLAKRQHNQYVSILRESGIRVIELDPLEGFPDSVFMQDPALLGLRRTTVGRFGERSRRGEEEALLRDLRDGRVDVGIAHFVRPPGTLEGGDVLITDHGIFVGDSKRTNSSGIKQLSKNLKDIAVNAVKTSMLHLLCGASYLNHKTMIIAPDLVDPGSFPGFRFVKIPLEEAYAADALYLGEGRVLIPSGFPKASMKLSESGYKPIEAKVSEFYKGDGGVTCLCSPLYELF
jgi:dimethylargininase